MGKMPLGTAFVLAVLVACGGPQGQGGPGSTCFRDDECDYGLVCAAVGAGERTCTSDVTGLVEQYAPALPAAGGVTNGGTTAGGAPAAAGTPANAGAVNAGAPASGGTSAGAPASAGQTSSGGASASGGTAPEPSAGTSG